MLPSSSSCGGHTFCTQFADPAEAAGDVYNEFVGPEALGHFLCKQFAQVAQAYLFSLMH